MKRNFGFSIASDCELFFFGILLGGVHKLRIFRGGCKNRRFWVTILLQLFLWARGVSSPQAKKTLWCKNSFRCKITHGKSHPTFLEGSKSLDFGLRSFHFGYDFVRRIGV